MEHATVETKAVESKPVQSKVGQPKDGESTTASGQGNGVRPVNGALGIVETLGLAAGVEAADSMVKAANVTILARQQVGGGLVAILIEGDVGAVKAAVDAGVAAASQVGKVVSAHVIPRPHDDVASVLKRKFVR